MAKIQIDIQAKDVNVSKTFDTAAKSADKLTQSASKTSKALGDNTTKAANQAGFALNNLGRVAQDAPFGFIAIQNNLNPLLESFQQLTTQTGSTSKALKAMVSGLSGAAGVGIALSAVSAGVLLYQQYQQRAAKETEKATDANDDYVSSLSQTNQALLNGAKSATDEQTKLRVLYETSQNLSLEYSQRKKAVDELQKQYPAYFKNISDETILAGGAEAAYTGLSNAILATARARAASDLITKNESVRLEKEQQLIDLIKERRQLDVQQNKERAKDYGPDDSFTGLNKINSVQEKINENLAKQREIAIDIVKRNQQNDSLSELISDQIKKGADISGNIGGKGLGETISKDEKHFRGAKIEIERTTNSLDEFLERYNKTHNDLISKQLIPIDKLVVTPLHNLSRTLIDFSKQASQIVSQGAAEGIGSFAMSIGEALANGDSVIKAIGVSLLDTIGQICVQLGKSAIAIGTGMLAIKAAFKNPLTAIAAGAALIAVGSFISNRVSKITEGKYTQQDRQIEYVNRPQKPPGFAGGVTNFQGGLAYVHAGELLTNLPTGTNVITKSKTDRLLSDITPNNNLDTQRAMSTLMNTVVNSLNNLELSTNVSGSDLKFVLSRNEHNRGRGLS